MTTFLRLTLALCVLNCSPTSHAWNKGGHQATGAVAFRELATDNPAVISKVQAIMKSHPTLALLGDQDKSKATDETTAERLFMKIAIWPDEVRPPSGYAKDFHRETWHWINTVYTLDGSKFAKPTEVVKDRIFEAFSKNVSVVSSPSATDAEKAIALCWIFHLVGDLHQPLHTTALFNEEFPDGDKGGNSTKIRAKEGARIISLHQFWDGAVLGSSDPKAARNAARKLRAAYPKSGMTMMQERPYINSGTFENWGRQESAQLAVSVAYDGGNLLKAQRDDGAYLLSPEYIAKAKVVADSQATLAGYRLAEVLTNLLGDKTPKSQKP